MSKIDVFICKECGYEDSSIIPMKKHLKTYTCPNCDKIVKLNIVKMEHGEDMTLKEYLELVKYINENHSFRQLKGKMIKYISHTLDFRTGHIHRVTLNHKEFATINENRHRNLKEWIYRYLNS
ncbi:hypothetical protein [Alkaliphilus sp. B6464]|uniref:hypothetical protein n=1 Tax=Alkaliphilus sp. B6464 TaxID=2731219 RepID=UPI001BA9F63B|nr:hypothetical protein [Alkaliphilus sp. B6464]QUH22066.1 hypothetical protein HYG84_19360 [Alkaliphilus sp. B6464]